MERVTSDLIGLFHQDYPQPWRFPDLLRRAKEEAARTNVDFMSLGEAEMSMLAQAIRFGGGSDTPSRWVEIGALTGFSALCLFSTLAPGSELWTIEKSPERCAFLRDLFADSRLEGRLHVVEGDSRAAKSFLEGHGPFDGVFIDGAKAEYLNDLNWAELHVRRGGLIVADNVFLGGAVFKATVDEDDRYSTKQVHVMRAYLDRVSQADFYQTLVLPSSDGLAVSRKLFA